MKTKHILLIVILAIALGVVISTFSDTNPYADFSVASLNPEREFHVIGTLDTTRPMQYDPMKPNYFSFYVKDDKGIITQVEYHNAKPQDFEKSEKIVLIGRMQGTNFQANSILLKCPSKYNDDDKPQAFADRKF